MAKEKKKQISKNPYKKAEFDAFLELIRGDTIAHWVQVAEALNIDTTTITAWKKLPLAQKAIRDGIEKAMEGMEKAGKDEWKMWESKLKMLGVSPIEKQDFTSGGQNLILGVVSYKPVEPRAKPKKKKKDDKK